MPQATVATPFSGTLTTLGRGLCSVRPMSCSPDVPRRPSRHPFAKDAGRCALAKAL